MKQKTQNTRFQPEHWCFLSDGFRISASKCCFISLFMQTELNEKSFKISETLEERAFLLFYYSFSYLRKTSDKVLNKGVLMVLFGY